MPELSLPPVGQRFVLAVALCVVVLLAPLFAPENLVFRPSQAWFAFVAGLLVMYGARRESRAWAERTSAQSCDLAYEMLRASEERLRGALDAAHMVAWDWNPSTGKLFKSDNTQQILGACIYNAEAALCLVHDDDAERVSQTVRRIAVEGGPYVLQFRIVRPDDGQVRWLEARGSAVRDGHGRAVRVGGVLMDITERKTTEEALRESEERFRVMAETVPGVVFTTDSGGRCDYVNQAFQDHLGLPLSSGVNNGWTEALHPDDRPRHCDAWAQALAAGSEFRSECRFRARDGSYRWFLVHCRPVTDAAGRIMRWVGSCNDVDDLKRADEQVRLAASAMENAVEGVLITDANNRVVSVNKAFAAITGYTPREVIGKSPRMLHATRDDAASYNKRRRALKEKDRWQGEVWNRRKDGEIYPAWVSMSAVRHDGEITHFVSVFSDISGHKRTEARLEFLAHHDPLTGLPNRALFQERLEEMVERAQRRRYRIGLLFIDLDRFKHINDSLGHTVGDELLRIVAERIGGCVRESDVVARLGGDEFTVLLDELKEPQEASRIAQQLLDVLSRPLNVGGQKLFVSASIGVSCFPENGSSGACLIRNADAAMYRAKDEGRNRYRFFSAEMNAHAAERLFLTNGLRLAISRNELTLVYQPRIDLYSGRLVGIEALVRWQHPEQGMLLPSSFIALAEESGLIEPIGEWVLRSACGQLRAWNEEGLDLRRVAVNLSLRQFNQPDLAQRIRGILSETGVHPNSLELEITETMVMQDVDRTDRVLAELHELGIPLAVDDFGTGYSSLSYLKRFPITYLKVDRSFVRGLPEDSDDAAITRAILAMAKSLRLRVIAEGVETDAQRIYLRDEGCEEGQGYLFSRPLPAEGIRALLSRQETEVAL